MRGRAGASGGQRVDRSGIAVWNVAWELALDSALAEVAGELERRGVQSLLLKGPALARWLYDEVAARSYSDVDLLIAPDQFGTARACVRELGFNRYGIGLHPHENAEYHESWLRTGPYPAVLELHRTLHLLSAPPELVWQRLSADSETIEVAGTPIRVPRTAGRALIVGLHAAQHGHKHEQPMQDLQRAIERADTATWQEAAGIARELGSLPALSAGLRLVPEGWQLTRTLGISSEQAARSVRLLAATAPDTAYGIEQLVSTPGVRGRLTLLARELVPSATFMRTSSALARRGTFGLIAAYALRPVRLGLKLPGGIAAWLRAAIPAASERPGTRRWR